MSQRYTDLTLELIALGQDPLPTAPTPKTAGSWFKRLFSPLT